MTDPTPPAAPRLCECGHARQMHNGVDECHAGGDQWECECKAYRPASAEAEPRLCECGCAERSNDARLGVVCFDCGRPVSPEAAPPRATTPPLYVPDGYTLVRAEDYSALQEIAAAARSANRANGTPTVEASETTVAADRAPSRDSGALLAAWGEAFATLKMFAQAYDNGQCNLANLDWAKREEEAVRAAVDRHIASLERDAARMREDSARLDWYDQNGLGGGVSLGVFTDGVLGFHRGRVTETRWCVGSKPYGSLRAAIDAARAALTPSGEPTTTPAPPPLAVSDDR